LGLMRGTAMTSPARMMRWASILFCVAMTGMTWGAVAAAPDVVTAPSTTDHSRFGVVTHIATRFGIYGQENGPMDIAAGTGAGWIREEIRWDWVEHPLFNWDWGFSDEMVQDARGRNLQILGLLGYNNSAQTMGKTNFTYPDIGLWKTYVSQVVNRYKGTIHTWEVWNEPDVPMFWQGSVADYVNLLRETYTTIKAIDPTATVLNG